MGNENKVKVKKSLIIELIEKLAIVGSKEQLYVLDKDNIAALKKEMGSEKSGTSIAASSYLTDGTDLNSISIGMYGKVIHFIQECDTLKHLGMVAEVASIRII